MLIPKIRKTKLVMGLLLIILSTGITIAQQKSAKKMDASDQEIIFKDNTWKGVTAEAKKTGKYIFVDAYTSWCAPCKLLKSTTFKDKSTAAYFNEHFINYTADMEKGEGLKLAEKWNITAYPALLFFSPDGKMVLKQVGYVDGKRLVDFGNQAMTKR